MGGAEEWVGLKSVRAGECDSGWGCMERAISSCWVPKSFLLTIA